MFISVNISQSIALIFILSFLVAFHEVSLSQDEMIQRQSDAVIFPDTALAANYFAKAKAFYETAQYDSSLVYAEKAKHEYTTISTYDDSDEIWELLLQCYNLIGTNLTHLDKHDSALTYLTYALNEGLKRFGESNLTVAKSYNNIGMIYQRYHNDYARAMEFFQQALSIRTRLLGDEHADVGASYGNIGWIHYLQGDNERALGYTRRSLKIRLGVFGEYHWTVGDSYQQLGGIYGRKGDLDRSMGYFRKALSVYREVLNPDHMLIAMCYRNLSLSYYYKGDYERALNTSREALSIYLRLFGESHRLIATNYNTLGIIYQRIGDYDKSLDFHKRALSIRRQVFGEFHLDVAGSYTNIGNVYSNRGDFENALDYHQMSLSITLEILGETHPRVARNYNNIGVVYRYMGDHELAFEYYNKALSIRTRLFGELHPDVAVSQTNIGLHLYDQGDYDRALEYYQRALHTGIQLDGEKHPEVSRRYRSIARTYLRKGDLDSALQYSQKSLASLVSGFDDLNVYSNPPLEGISSELYLLDAFKLKAEIFTHLSDLETVLNIYELSADLIDQIRTGYKAEGSKLFLGEKVSDVFQHAIQTSLALYETTGDDEYKYRAFGFAEKSKAAVLQDGLTEVRAVQFSNIPRDLLEDERQLRIDIAYYENRVQRETRGPEDSGTDEIRELENRLFNFKRQYREMVERLEREYPDYFNLKYATQTVSVQEMRDRLSDDTVILEYFTGEEHIYIFTVWNTGFDVYAVKQPEDLTGLVMDFYTSILKSESRKYLSSSVHLSRLLIEPVLPVIQSKKNLVIIPHDILYKVPFDALLMKNPAPAQFEGRVDFTMLDYLVKSFNISYHHSATLYVKGLKEKSPTVAENSFIGFAPVFSGDDGTGYTLASDDLLDMASDYEDLFRSVVIDGAQFDELRYSEWEVKSIIELFAEMAGDRTSRAYFHGDATEDVFKAEVKDFRVIHIATHSFINEERPQLSGVVFAQDVSPNTGEDGVLYAGETYNLELNADLVVLSSCESGVGKLIRGEGMMALSRGFLYSGARNIIFSLWKIPDRHTSELMVEFYRQMLSGYSYAESLRRAKLSLIENPATARPRSWASFILVGTD